MTCPCPTPSSRASSSGTPRPASPISFLVPAFRGPPSEIEMTGGAIRKAPFKADSAEETIGMRNWHNRGMECVENAYRFFDLRCLEG